MAASRPSASRASWSLCHVVPPSLYPEGMGYGSPTHNDVEEGVRERMSEIAAEWVDPGVPCEVHVWTGNVYKEIVDRSKELGIDLIVLPTHGRTGLSHFLMGSTAERVVRTAPCDVLVLCCEGLKKAAK